MLIERPSSREAAGYLEAALIAYTTGHTYFSSNSINLARNDIGGSGGRREQIKELPHYVYVAIYLTDRGT